MRVTIFGATGLLGKELMRGWNDDEVIGLGSNDADLRNAEQVSRLVQSTRPDWIVLAAAYTDVDGCEINEQLARNINYGGAVHVAEAAKRAGARLLFVSTDYVFDGSKNVPYETTDARQPRSVYGKWKAEAEIKLIELLPQCVVLRTSWLFGTGGKCFPDTILKLAAARPSIEVVNDQRGSPTYAVDLASAIIQLCRKEASGIVHATNRGDCTWFEFAREIVAKSGSNTIVRPTTSDKFVRAAERPKYSVLSPSSLEKYTIAMSSWKDALSRYLQERAE
jgi:dTDP-4-dehydrorhamnose reductase